ncbi:protein Star-like [Daphnia pulex]|uniref:protein Star-like n=1 Tax=Daphnia pulex TaxID=6669 RepID=UPI001EE0F32F|nr:protein Star-like [Daphnia pulex]XP_046439862.1 protein Star-like [Daphnia pulex]XP_046439863.1 protein Star-like [Daphnia pulex]
MSPVLKRPVVLFMGVCFACVILIYYQSSHSQGKPHYSGVCNTENVNSAVMDQDDPCILSLLRGQYLHPPSKNKLSLEAPEVPNPSMGQAQSILEILKNKENGFFVECGALDGELRSNTLFMERNLGWEGVLIEADPKNFLKVQEKNRRAWTVPACLSTSSSPKTVVFKQAFNQGRISQNQLDDQNRVGSVQVQCFPIYSILAALNRTEVDYFSLDIEGDELAVLKTIPWNNVRIQTLSVEFIHDKEGKDQIREYMTLQGYEVVKEVTDPNWLANDFIFNKI